MELKKLGFGIMALLLVGGAFAGVLDYYGKIEGTADVKAPTFYADSTQRIGVYYEMEINKKGSGSVSLKDGQRILFVSDALRINSWHPTTWKVHIKTDASAEGSLSSIRFKKVTSDLTGETTICEWTNINVTEGTNEIVKTCSPGKISFSTDEGVGLEITGSGSLNYNIYTGGSTWVTPQ